MYVEQAALSDEPAFLLLKVLNYHVNIGQYLIVLVCRGSRRETTALPNH